MGRQAHLGRERRSSFRDRGRRGQYGPDDCPEDTTDGLETPRGLAAGLIVAATGWLAVLWLLGRAWR